MNNQTTANIIGVFDSGVGGLSVLKEIQKMLPSQPLYFIADQAHVPYGKREMSEIRDFAFAITDQFVSLGAKMIVVACNTASAAALKDLRVAFPELTFIGMEPAVKPASQTTHNGVVGVLATPATFQGELYNTLVEKFAKEVKVLTSTCPGLVEAIEAGELSNQNTRLILQQALLPMIEKGADTVVLGCTHFPFVVPTIKDIVGPNVSVIDPSPAIAKRVSSLLNESGRFHRSSLDSTTDYGTTGDTAKFKNIVHSLLKRDISPVQLKWENGKIIEINQ